MTAELKNRNPYPGPRPFEQEEQNLFFGRRREVRELLSLIIAHRVVLLYAQSGAGKTSLLNAGVIPLLSEGSFEVLPVARVRGFELEDIDLREISNVYVFNALMGWAGDRVQPRSFVSMSIAAFLKEREHLMDKEGLPLPRVAIFEQFEELFTSYPGRWKEREDFFRQVAEAVEADPLLRVLFVIREDYLAGLDSYVHFLPERLRTRYRLERLRAEAACQAVEGPLRDTECSFADGIASSLVKQLLNIRIESVSGEIVEVPGEYIEPVQLQIVCQSLWLNLPRRVTVITSYHLQEFGDVEKSLRSFYDRAIETAEKETGVKKMDLRKWSNDKLITPAGTRGIVFRGKEHTEGIPNSVVDVLEAQHIIRAEMRAGVRWYELTHDLLIEPIRKSNEVWSQHQRAEEQRRQIEAERQRARVEEQAKSARFLYRLKAALIVVLLIAAGTAVYAIVQRENAAKAEGKVCTLVWQKLLTEYLDWIEALRIDLGLPKGNEQAKRWKNNPNLRIIVEKIDQASYPYYVAHDNFVLAQDLRMITSQDDLKNYGILQHNTDAALKAVEIIKRFFDPKSDQSWPLLAEMADAANEFKNRGWQGSATYLSDLVESVKPGPNKPIVENVHMILELNLKGTLKNIESSLQNIANYEQTIKMSRDPVLVKLDYLYVTNQVANATNVNELSGRLGRVEALCREIAEFIESDWQTKVDQEAFVDDHGNDSTETPTELTFTKRLDVIKEYYYLRPDPREAIFSIVNRIRRNIEEVLISNPFEANKCKQDFDRLRPEIDEIQRIKAVAKNKQQIEQRISQYKPHLDELLQKTIAAREK